MLDEKIESLLKVYEEKSFTKAADGLNLTQPAVSHHISLLEKEYGVKIFTRSQNVVLPTPEGDIIIKYAKRLKAIESKMREEIKDAGNNVCKLRIGLTHTSESNLIAEVLAKFAANNNKINITIISDTIKNLYNMLENYEIDIAIIDGKNTNHKFNAILLDTDYIACIVSSNNQLSKKNMITLNELKKQRLILRLPSSATRILFESSLESLGESIHSFDVSVEVDNISTIKDLVEKDLGVSILAKSTCYKDIKKGKLKALTVENLSMSRETNLVYSKTFEHTDILQEISKTYIDTLVNYNG